MRRKRLCRIVRDAACRALLRMRLPTFCEAAARRASAWLLLAGAGGVRLQRSDALGQGAAALGRDTRRPLADLGRATIGGPGRILLDCRFSQHRFDWRVWSFQL